MIQHRLFLATAALAASLGIQAQTVDCDFETQDYQSVSTYDPWEASPLRTGELTGHARVVGNPYKDDSNASDSVVGFQRSRYGGQFYGARIDLNEPFALSTTTQYVHAYIYLPEDGTVGLVGLGNCENLSDLGTDIEQFIVLANRTIEGGQWVDAVFPVKGNDDARVYSLVIAPDASINPASGEDFMVYIDNITVNSSASPRISLGEYAINFDADQAMTRTDRHLDRMTFRAGSKSAGLTATSACRSTVYVDMTEDFTINVQAGDLMRATYVWTGNSMHSYTYADWGNDGKFNVDLESETPAEDSDLLAYSYYNGYNSNGESKAQGVGITSPTYYIPSDQPRGIYRGRTKIDWNNIDPAGNIDSDNYIVDNGGNIVDYLINVYTDNVSLNINARMCSVTLQDGSVLPDSVAFGEDLDLRVVMDEGYYIQSLEITHGYNLNGEQYIHGNRQYSTDTLDCEGLTNITIPSSLVDGDLSVTVNFTNTPPVGITQAEAVSQVGVSVEGTAIVLRSESAQPYKVVTSDGRIIAQGKVNGTKKLPNLTPGVYVVNGTKCVIN